MKMTELMALAGLLVCGCGEKKAPASKVPDISILRQKQESDAKRAERALAAAKEEVEMFRVENRRLESEVSRLKGDLRLAESRIENARKIGKAEAMIESLSGTTGSRTSFPATTYTPTPAARAAPAAREANVENPFWKTYQGVRVLRQIRDDADARWGTDYRMVEFQVGEQKEAFEKLLGYRKIHNRVTKGIVAEAEQRWGTDYKMVIWQIKEQSEAKGRLDGR